MSEEARGPVKVFLLVADFDVKEDSLTRRVLRATLEVLQAPAYAVTVTELAKDGWLDPVSQRDFKRVSDPIRINIQNEQQLSPLIPKIEEEQRKILQCDLFIILSPVSWFGLPSHFFAWWQRVVTIGKCYGPGMMYQTGAFAQKRAIVVMITDQAPETFGKSSVHGTMEELLYPVTHGMLYPTGFKIHRSQTLFMGNPDKYEEVLAKWQTALRDLNDRMCITFNQPTDYTNWTLSTPERERKNDLELLAQAGDMSLQEAAMRITAQFE